MDRTMADFAELIPSILEKTRERKLPWENLSGESYIARPEDSSLEIFAAAGAIENLRLVLRDDQGRALENVRWRDLTPPLDIQLEEIYAAARRQALRIDIVVQSLKDKLDKL
jgi:hypothetical protein